MSGWLDRAPVRIALLYLLAAGAWIPLSDRAVAALAARVAPGFSAVTFTSSLQTYKGWGFVLISVSLLFLLLRSEFRQQARIQTRLEESERAREALIQNLPGMVYRCQNERDWTMEYVSEGALPLTGYSPTDLIGKGAVSFGSLIHPEDREMVWQSVQEAIEEDTQFQVTYRLLDAHGEQKWVWEQGQPAASPEGTEAVYVEGFITDVTQSVHQEQALQRQLENVQALRAIDVAITSSLDQRLTFEVLLDQITARLRIDAADLLRYDRKAQTLDYAMGRGFRTEALRHTHLRPGEGFAGQAAVSRQMIVIEDLRDAGDGFQGSPRFAEEGFVFYCAAPLITKGQLRGVLEVFHRSPRLPSQDWFDFLEVLAGQAAIAIDNAALFQELQDSNIELVQAYDQTLEGWAHALEMRDQETVGHTRRVTELSLRLARKLGVPNEALTDLRRGALLHDIGKMAIPDSILLKPGPLDEEEWELMKRHPEFAHEMLAKIEYLQPALEIPYCHHEKWDGSGYPRGLAGEDIPMAARIFAVVDVWDALRSDRHYREAWSEHEARQYLRRQRGKHFDPAVVDAFFTLLGQG